MRRVGATAPLSPTRISYGTIGRLSVSPKKGAKGPHRPRATVACALLSLSGLFLSACGNDAIAACAPVEQEALDPLSSQHVVPGVEVTYLSDPPTSGPHLGLPPLTGAIDGPMESAMQVTALEAGSVIIHHDGATDLAALEDLAGDDVLLVESSSLDQPIELTAWRTRQRCSSVDLAAIRSFIRDHAGRAPSH